jgi:hypothetical protein
MQVIAMKCPGCGASLQVASDMDDFACGYCGTALRAIRQGGTVSLIAAAIAKVQGGTDRTAAELALVRLERELGAIQDLLAYAYSPKPPAPTKPTMLKSSKPSIFTKFFAHGSDSSLIALSARLKIHMHTAVTNSNNGSLESYNMEVQLWEEQVSAWEEAQRSIGEWEQQQRAILSQIADNESIVRRPIR